MRSDILQVLGQNNLEAVFKKTDAGLMADTYICNVLWEDGKRTKAYVKRFLKCNFLGLVNETTGYILAKHSNLPVPSKAGLIKVNPNSFPNPNEYNEWAFVISEAPGSTPGSFYDNGALEHCKSLMDLVANWSKVSDTITFDDWVANQDRNLGNLVVAGVNDIFLIDHSNLPFTLNWQIKDLSPSRQSKNILAQNLWGFECTPLPVKAKISFASTEHTAIFTRALDDLNFWWNALLVNSPEYVNALKEFLCKRAEQSQDRISANHGMLAV